MSVPEVPLHLFAGFGIELEYMLVDARTLAVLPVADAVLRAAAGSTVADFEDGEIGWSNELVLHLLELKTRRPGPRLEGLPALFQRSLGRMRELLAPLGGRLMPTGMHPWMDPTRETQLWPHEGAEIYQTFDRLFDCRRHGWANLQSVHLNLPFAGDEEFGRLHAAIRLVLPLLPALAASSPVVDGRVTGILDNRLEFYRSNATRVPSVAGRVVPEPVYTRAEYESRILERIYRDMAPLDTEGVLRDEWANARGAIARFERSAFEIRILDMQECPLADLATAALASATVRALVDERWADWEEQKRWPTERLAALLRAVVRDGERTLLGEHAYLEVFGVRGDRDRHAGEVWQHLAESLLFGTAQCTPGAAGASGAAAEAGALGSEWRRPLEIILERGPLARRILEAVGARPDRERLSSVYRRLCDCLDAGTLFE